MAVVFLIYLAWAAYSGLKWVNGKYAWLEEPGTMNKVCKIAVGLGVGIFLGCWFFALWIVKFAIRLTDR